MSPTERLTPEQEARFPEFVQRWTEIGLSTAPTDRPAAEAAVAQAYRLVGLKPPEKIVWCGSPFSQGLTRAIVLDKKMASVWDSVGASVGASIGDSVWASVGASVADSVWASVGDNSADSVRASVWASVADSVWASVWDSVGASVWTSVWDSVGDSVADSVWASVRANSADSVRASVWASVGASVGASIGDSVWTSVWDSVGDSVADSVWASVRDSGYGQHDAAWIAFYNFFREAVGLKEQTDKLAGLVALCRTASWYSPHQRICWISERHNVLNRDDRGRLHSLTGPACAYPDGWAIYAVHGVRVPERVVMQPESLTAKEIDTEQNAEVRRVMVERFGLERYILESGAKLIGTDECGALYRKEQGDDEAIVAVHVVNSTPEPDGSRRKYILRVPPQIKSAREAVAWTFGLNAKGYKPRVET